MFTAFLGAMFSWVVANSNLGHGWIDSYSQALAEVKRLDRPLFVVLDQGSSELAKTVAQGHYLSPEVEEVLMADYVRVFIDIETESGRTLGEQFGVSELPRIVIIDRSGDWQVYRRSGNPIPSEVLTQLTKYRRTLIKSNAESVETRSAASTSSRTPALCKT